MTAQDAPTFADLVESQPSKPAPSTAVERAVAVMTSLKDAALARFSKTEADLQTLAAKYRNVAFDVTTTKGMAEAKAARLELRESGRYAVQRIRDATKTEANDLKRVIEDKAEALIGLVKPVEDAIDAQITAEEECKAAEKAAKEAAEAAERERLAQIERQRVEAHETGLAKIRGYLTRCEGLESGRIAIGISMLAQVVIGDDWQEFKPRAEEAKEQTLAAMQALHDKTLAQEQEAARLEQQRIENERVAAENARIAADLKRQQDALDAARAEEQAKAQRKAADELAAAQAESGRLEALAEANRRRQQADALAEAPAASGALDAYADAMTRRGPFGLDPTVIPDYASYFASLDAEAAEGSAGAPQETPTAARLHEAFIPARSGAAHAAAPIEGRPDLKPQQLNDLIAGNEAYMRKVAGGVDPKFCPGSNPDNPQPYPDPFADLLAHLHAGIDNDRFPSHPKPHKGWWDELKVLMAAAESAQ